MLQYIDYTYVRAQSPQLDATLRNEVAAFSNDLRRVCAVGPSAGAGATGGLGDGGIRAGQVPLESFSHNLQLRSSARFRPICFPWSYGQNSFSSSAPLLERFLWRHSLRAPFFTKLQLLGSWSI